MVEGPWRHGLFHTLELRSALALALALEHAPMGLLMLHDQFTGRLYPALSSGMTTGQCATIGLHRPGVGPIGIAFSECRSVAVTATGALDDDVRSLMQAVRCPRLSVVPLVIDPPRVLGLLVLLYRRRQPSPAAPVLLLYASVLAVALGQPERRQRSA
jgi:hypothetical protein